MGSLILIWSFFLLFAVFLFYTPAVLQRMNINNTFERNRDEAIASYIHAEEERIDPSIEKQRWLLCLRHCAKCDDEAGCRLGQKCLVAKNFWKHVLFCNNDFCEAPKCTMIKSLLKHHRGCEDASCAVCVPVKNYVSPR